MARPVKRRIGGLAATRVEDAAAPALASIAAALLPEGLAITLAGEAR